MTRPKTEPTTMPAIVPLFSQGPVSTSGFGVGVGVVLAVVVDVPANVGLEAEEVSAIVLVFVGGCPLLVRASAVVDGTGAGVGAADEVLGLADVVVPAAVDSEVMKFIDVINWIDVTRVGGFASS
jgi:hypothetical protein